jgi:hypothetical protein
MIPGTNHRQRFPQKMFTFMVFLGWATQSILAKVIQFSLGANIVMLARDTGAELFILRPCLSGTVPPEPLRATEAAKSSTTF